MIAKQDIIKHLLVGEGFCYTALFQTKYRYDAVAVLGKLPYLADLLDFVDANGSWLASTSRYTFNIDLFGIVHIECDVAGDSMVNLLLHLRLLCNNNKLVMIGAEMDLNKNLYAVAVNQPSTVQVNNYEFEIFSSEDSKESHGIISKSKKIKDLPSYYHYVKEVKTFFKSYVVSFESECKYKECHKTVLGFKPKDAGHRSMLVFINYNKKNRNGGVAIHKFLTANNLNDRLSMLTDVFFEYPVVKTDRQEEYTISKHLENNKYRFKIVRADDSCTITENNKAKFLGKTVGYLANRIEISVYNYRQKKHEPLELAERCAFLSKYIKTLCNKYDNYQFDARELTKVVCENYRTNMTCFFLIVVDKPNLDDDVMASIYDFYFPARKYHIIKNDDY